MSITQREEEFRSYLKSSGFAGSTINTRCYALKRIEKAQGIDLDAEAQRDGFRSLIALFSADAAGNVPTLLNTIELGIAADNKGSALSWYRSHLKSYFRFSVHNAAPDSQFDDEEMAVEDEAGNLSFALEKDLQTALRANIQQLEEGLEIIDGGMEHHVASGFIDILARDRDGVTVVIELKASISQPKAVAQILGYMGAIAEQQQLDRVRGYLIAAGHHKQVIWATKAIPNLALKSYGFKFSFFDS